MENKGKSYSTTITGKWVLKVTGEGKGLMIMSRRRPYKSQVQYHGYMTFEKDRI
jgi:hypothetical protein